MFAASGPEILHVPQNIMSVSIPNNKEVKF
jgi:hypothetical protein